MLRELDINEMNAVSGGTDDTKAYKVEILDEIVVTGVRNRTPYSSPAGVAIANGETNPFADGYGESRSSPFSTPTETPTAEEVERAETCTRARSGEDLGSSILEAGQECLSTGAAGVVCAGILGALGGMVYGAGKWGVARNCNDNT